MKKVLLALLMSLVAVSAMAQTPVNNPTIIQWDAEDHAITSRYEVGYTFIGAVDPFLTVFINKTDTTAIDADTFSATFAKPALGTFVAKMRACGTGADSVEVCSDWSDISNSFKFTPKKPRAVGAR